MIVVDASAILELLLRNESSIAIEERLFAPGESLHSPHLMDIEVAHALCRLNRERALSVERGMQALADLAAMPLARYPHHIFLPRVWELRQSVTAYDAAYVALAEALRAPLLTRDARLAAAVGKRVRVELV